MRHETVGPDLGGRRQVCGTRSQEYSIETVCQGIQDEVARQDSKSLIRFSVVLCNATSRSGEGACLNHDVLRVGRTLRHQPSTFPRISPETHLHPYCSRRSSEIW